MCVVHDALDLFAERLAEMNRDLDRRFQERTSPPEQAKSLGNALSMFVVRSRNSCINEPIRSTSSSNAKWPVSRRWRSALGISLCKSSAPSTVKIPSFLPQVISVGG